MDTMEARIRYLEAIQRIIDRLSTISSVIKGWSVTLTAALLVLASKDSNKGFFLVSYLPILFFWFIDSEYLRMERQYKALYNQNADFKIPLCDFRIKRPKPNSENHTYFAQCFFSRTELSVYLPQLLSILLVFILQ